MSGKTEKQVDRLTTPREKDSGDNVIIIKPEREGRKDA